MAKAKKKNAGFNKVVQSGLAKVDALRHELKRTFHERDSEIDGALTALVARQHVLLLGPPGTAKSALARVVCEAIDGASYFKWLLTKFSTPEELFGPMSLKALEQDQYRRVTAGKMPEASVAFLDECFKANSAILNSLLTILEEREFDNGSTALACPLLSCFGASNELPKDDSLGALYDRFVLRFWVSPLTDHDAMKAVYLSDGAPSVKATITGEELTFLQTGVAAVDFPNDVAESMLAVKRALAGIGVQASDRRWKSCVQIVRARALLRGSMTVSSSDLLVLGDCMWREPDQRQRVAEVVGEIASPLVAEALQISDAAKQAHKQLLADEGTPAFLDRAVNVRADLKEMRQRLQSMLDEHGDACPEAVEAMDSIRKLQADAKRRHDRALD